MMNRRNGKQSGFTLIELMIVVAIIGILAAVAVPAFMEYMKKGKRSEADLALNRLAKSAKAFYVLNSRYPNTNAGPIPDATSCDDANKIFAPNAANWTGPFAELEFVIEEAHRFDLTYTAGPTDQSFVVVAHADLDCDNQGGNIVTVNGALDNTGSPSFTWTRTSND